MPRKAAKNTRSEVVYVRVTPKIKKWVTKFAKEKGISVSDYVQVLLTAQMNNEDTQDSEDTSLYAQFR